MEKLQRRTQNVTRDNIMAAVQYAKYQKDEKKPSIYQEYLESYNGIPVPEDIFMFVVSKVYTSLQPFRAGQKDKIFMWRYGIVDAIFLRRYAQGQIWMVGDNLVMTCPTNTELVSGTYQEIFTPLLGETKKVDKSGK